MIQINFFLTLILLLPSFTSAESPCSPSSLTLASAGTWDNLRNNENSIKFQIAHLMAKAIGDKKEANFEIKSTPNKFLSSYSDKNYCEGKLKETENDNLKYNSPSFSSLEDLNAWIADFSQGKGDAGNLLYDQCDKSCSPQYTYKISYTSSPTKSYTVTALVICGPARDKDDNQYSLSLTCP